MNAFASLAATAMLMLAACSSSDQSSLSSKSPIALSVSTDVVKSSPALPPAGFCDLGRQAVAGTVALTVSEQADRLTKYEGLSDQQRALMRAAVADAVPQIEGGAGWDDTVLVAAVNEICDLDLAPSTLTP